MWWDRKCTVYYKHIPQKSDIEFRQIPFPIELIENSNPWKIFRIVQSKKCHLPSEQYQTLCFFADLAIIGTAWLGCHTSLTLHLHNTTFSNSYRILLNGKNFNFLEAYKNYSGQFIIQKDANVWEDRNLKLSQKWQKVVEQNGLYKV